MKKVMRTLGMRSLHKLMVNIHIKKAEIYDKTNSDALNAVCIIKWNMKRHDETVEGVGKRKIQ